MSVSRQLFLMVSFVLPLFTSMMTYANETAKPIRIGVSLGLTGSYEKMSQLQSRAFKLWEKQVNDRGGVLGRPVQITIQDDASNADNAKKIYEDFILRDKVDFVFGPFSSALTSAIVPLTEKHGYPTLASGAASDDLWRRGYQRLFSLTASADRYTIGLLSILSEANIKRLAIVHTDDVFAVSLAEGTKKWAAEYGVEIVLFHKVLKNTADLTQAAQAARDSGAEAILMSGHDPESINMRKALKQINWTPKAYYASIGPGLNAYRSALGEDAEGTFSSSIWEDHEGLKLPGSMEFLRGYTSAYNEQPSYHAARAYAAAQILEYAIKVADSTERKAVEKALFQIDVNTLIGRYVVDRTGAQIKGFPMIIQWQKGKREIVWPEKLQTAQPVFNK